MIELKIDYQKQLRGIEQRLGALKSEAPRVLVIAVNETAKKARLRLAKQAQQTYTVKTGRFQKEIGLQKARVSRPTAVLRATGRAQGLSGFRVSPAKVQTGENRPAYIRAKVLRKGGLKPLVKGDAKAFVARFRNGHVAVVEREGKKRYPLCALYSLSDPAMLGSKLRVYGVIEPHIESDLAANIDRQIARALAKGGR